MEKSYRLRTEVGKDQVVRAQFKQDIDFLEILSLKIKQEDAYQLHVSNYGMIVGRVIGNNAFGIQNAKVSVFIPITDEDASNSEILNLYPYKSLQTLDNENRRYNLLPNTSNDECYRIVGTFPNKRMVLDNNTEIEIFEKYWKYTTVTNKSGDYCIMGVPTGNQEIHVDIDLSDIGILSQKPRDFVYKGYNIEQFDNASQFKESTNLDSLTQIFTQNTSVHVYPFWGEEDVEEVAITRCDIQIQYQFEPTCVFFGSIVSDNVNNSISKKCNPSKNIGFNRNLVAGEGTIEMIRKTHDGLVEEFPIQGNRLIDGNGVWCYQIPMNLDYVGTDEFGNIVPTDNPNKGIPTRTRVRFRFSMQETDNEGISRHRAKYLVPNNFDVVPNDGFKPSISGANKYDQCYEFGSSTPDDQFRDLYWNKVYTVKNYIPRIQKNKMPTTQKYIGIKTVNSDGNFNPFPFNHARFRLVFGYRLLCIIAIIVVDIISIINKMLATLACWRPFDVNWSIVPKKLKSFQPLSPLCEGLLEKSGGGDAIHCISLTAGLTEDSNDNTIFYPNCTNASGKECAICAKAEDKNADAQIVTDGKYIKDIIQDNLAQEYDVVNLDFYNDWVNGVLYFPLWFLKQVKKKKYLFGLITRKAKNKYCNCDKTYKRIRLFETCSMRFKNNYDSTNLLKNEKELSGNNSSNIHKSNTDYKINFGIIKEFTNRLGKQIYYYSPGKPLSENYNNITSLTDFSRLFSTDIVLLGSLNDCDIDSLPRPYINLPSTTANIPYIYSTMLDEDDETSVESQIIEDTGLDWMTDYKATKKIAKYGKGLLMSITCNAVSTLHKSCVNLQRISELGVSTDSTYEEIVPNGNDVNLENSIYADGMITRYELIDNETRGMFASLNHNGLVKKVLDENTTYEKYDLKYVFPTDFDGHMSSYSAEYTKTLEKQTYDNRNEEYIKFKFGENVNGDINYMYYGGGLDGYTYPLYNNSFYFYFGLNVGNTAIDKFNNLFYSSCFKNEKYPFSLLVTSTPKPWCDSENGAIITCELKGISMPYEAKLESFGNNIIVYSGQSLTDKTLLINRDVNNSIINNGNYLLTLKDNFGNEIKKEISIDPIYISINYETSNLGGEYDGNKALDEKLWGKIIIKSFNIDGNTEYIISNNSEININEKNVQCNLNLTNGYTAKLLIKLNDDSVLNNNNYKFVFEDNNAYKNIIISTTKPSNFNIEAIQICNNEETENKIIYNVNIINGKNFMAFINDIPMELLNPNTSKDNWHGGVTYQNNNLFYFDSLLCYNKTEKGYILLNDYAYSILKRYISTSQEYDAQNNKFINPLDVAEIIKYKFECIFNLSKDTIMIDDYSDCFLSITSEGGKSPIEYRNAYPLNDNYFLDSDGYYYCPSNLADLVNGAYYDYENDIEPTMLSGLTSNPIIDNMYKAFAVFTENGNGQIVPSSANITVYKLQTNIEYLPSYFQKLIEGFFKGYFVNNNFGFNLSIHIDKNINKIIINGKTCGGIKMSYDENHNIIGDNLEYSYNEQNGMISYNNNEPSKKYYSFDLNIIYDDGYKEEPIDLRDCGDEIIEKEYDIKSSNIMSMFFSQRSCSYDIEMGSSIDEQENIKIYGIVKPSNEIIAQINLEEDSSFTVPSGYIFNKRYLFKYEGGKHKMPLFYLNNEPQSSDMIDRFYNIITLEVSNNQSVLVLPTIEGSIHYSNNTLESFNDTLTDITCYDEKNDVITDIEIKDNIILSDNIEKIRFIKFNNKIKVSAVTDNFYYCYYSLVDNVAKDYSSNNIYRNINFNNVVKETKMHYIDIVFLQNQNCYFYDTEPASKPSDAWWFVKKNNSYSLYNRENDLHYLSSEFNIDSQPTYMKKIELISNADLSDYTLTITVTYLSKTEEGSNASTRKPVPVKTFLYSYDVVEYNDKDYNRLTLHIKNDEFTDGRDDYYDYCILKFKRDGEDTIEIVLEKEYFLNKKIP